MKGKFEEKQNEEGFENQLTVENRILVRVACSRREFFGGV